MSADKAPGSSASRLRGWWLGLVGIWSAEPRDRDALLRSLRVADSRDLLDAYSRSMMEGVLTVADMQARDIMIPRSHMVVVERDATPQELLPIIIESGHSRFPVIGEDRDEVVGILLAKDLLRFFAENGDTRFDIRECLRAPVFIPESKRLNVLLKEIRVSHNHMAIVVDEYGGVAGLITIEDVLEQIVGDIGDEHDIEEEELIRDEGEGRYTVEALTRVDAFNAYFGTDFGGEDYDTVAGLLMHELGRLPRRGELIELSGLDVKVMKADSRRIGLLQVRRSKPPRRERPGVTEA